MSNGASEFGLEEHPRPGIYGFSLALDEPDEQLGARLVLAPPAWPELRVRRTVERAAGAALEGGESRARVHERPAAGGEVKMDESTARVELPNGTATMRRDAREAWFRTSTPLTTDELVHPLLGYAALAFSHWMGREAFHAGVFLRDGGAWALIGERGSGKSSTLAWLAREGHRIVADDLLVLDGRTAFAGPRTIDLASASAAHLGWAEGLEDVRQGFRQRLTLEELAPEHQLSGWISLRWGDEVSMAPVPAAGRIPLLVEHGNQPMGLVDWPRLLALASLPMFELSRPHRLASLEPTGELLLATVTAAAA
jgi:hypothetical protein